MQTTGKPRAFSLEASLRPSGSTDKPLSILMRRAWTRARMAAAYHGGPVRSYLSESLRQMWGKKTLRRRVVPKARLWRDVRRGRFSFMEG